MSSGVMASDPLNSSAPGEANQMDGESDVEQRIPPENGTIEKSQCFKT